MNADELDLPAPMRALPRDKHGHPVPWFVDWADGAPDFRIVRRRGIEDALRFGLCWVCGGPRGVHAAFTIGPMCAVNRTSAEPPAHRDCAVWSALHCPFMSRPEMVRRERNLPAERHVAGGMIERNPGVALVWVTRRWKPFPAPGGLLFELGDPVATFWYARGRKATRTEILAAMESGLPILREVAEADPAGAVEHLDREYARALRLVPADAGSA